MPSKREKLSCHLSYERSNLFFWPRWRMKGCEVEVFEILSRTFLWEWNCSISQTQWSMGAVDLMLQYRKLGQKTIVTPHLHQLQWCSASKHITAVLYTVVDCSSFHPTLTWTSFRSHRRFSVIRSAVSSHFSATVHDAWYMVHRPSRLL
jgi:hypothetical protein